MIQYSCNLNCNGCITMTNYRRSGYVSADEGESWIRQWSQKIFPEIVCLFGGEPMMNPDVYKWIKLVRDYWPTSTLKIITNGFFFNKKPEIVRILYDSQPSELQVSLHFRDDYHRKNILDGLIKTLKQTDLILKPCSTRAPQEQRIFAKDDFKLIIAEFGEFVKPYRGYGKNMRPWESKNIIASHSHCGSPRNPVLYKNRIYKCSPIANLKDTLNLFGQVDSPQWEKYLSYVGFGINDNLDPLIENFGKPEWICSMCPSNNNSDIAHYDRDSVKVKKGAV